MTWTFLNRLVNVGTIGLLLTIGIYGLVSGQIALP